MKRGVIARFLSIVALSVSLFLLLPLIWAIAYADGGAAALFSSFLIGIAVSSLLSLRSRNVSLEVMTVKESLLSVCCSWLLVSAIGCLPYWFGGHAPTYLDAFFEGISGFTTTGASVLPHLETIPRSILLWRSLTQWMGGMGLIMLMLAVFPISGAGMNLYKSEIPGPLHIKLTPRLRGTAGFLWGAYLLLTAVFFLLLLLGGLDVFDSLTLAFSTIATGGFSPYRESVGHFASDYVTWITGLFLFLSGVNFTLYHQTMIKRSLMPALQDGEFRFYSLIVLIVGPITALSLYYGDMGWGAFECLSQGIFQTVSMISTCGFFISDYSSWPTQTHMLLLALMFCGGCAVSSAGGITCIRLLIVLRHVREEFLHMLHPRAVIPSPGSGRAMAPGVVSGSLAFFTAYLFIYALGVLASTLFGQDIVTALFGTASTLGNIGPGFGAVGPYGSYAATHPALKVIYIFLMLCGRLEIFTLLVPLLPNFWRR